MMLLPCLLFKQEKTIISSTWNIMLSKLFQSGLDSRASLRFLYEKRWTCVFIPRVTSVANPIILVEFFHVLQASCSKIFYNNNFILKFVTKCKSIFLISLYTYFIKHMYMQKLSLLVTLK